MKINEFKRDDYITCDFWLKDICQNYDWNPGMEIKPLTFVEPSKLKDFFKVCETHTQKVVVVSAASDFTICEQSIDHPNDDIIKLIKGAILSNPQFPRERYIGLQPFQAPLEIENCDPRHRYSVKMDRFTKFTFDKIPDCISHWFCANLNAEVPRTTWLPFGLAPSHDPKQTRDYFLAYLDNPKSSSIYINFSDYTTERLEAKEFYKTKSEFNYYIEKTNNLSAKEYVEKLTSHLGCLAPPGNGLDCYRTYECFYTGVIPIIKECVMSSHITKHNLPIITYKNVLDIKLDHSFNYNRFNNKDLTVLSTKYWKDKINDSIRYS